MTNSVSSVTSRLNSISYSFSLFLCKRRWRGKKLSYIIVYSVKKKMIHLYFTTCTLNNMLFHTNMSLVTLKLLFQLPEMMSVDSRDGENPFFHLVFQACGMFLGIGIMLIIAMYEDKMKTMMEP